MAVETRWWNTHERASTTALPENVGAVRITVEIELPEGNGKRAVKSFHLFRAFSRNQSVWIKDLIEVSLDQTNTHLHRNWEQEIEPWLTEHEV